ncbi:MAG: relaxase/mobilization nuclease domain-containing protein [Oscillospiraceae bacterium]|nr:relaxase/mobilization nuclease domain-containing protein [Oscillospiraceae bacterium]
MLAYHIRVSYKPGEITPELANKLGYELAIRFTRGRHAFIVVTHIDRRHIHNHIIFNSTTLDYTRKFDDPKRSGMIIRRISDRICVENELSVIQNSKLSRGHYGKWLGDQKKPSHRQQLYLPMLH